MDIQYSLFFIIQKTLRYGIICSRRQSVIYIGQHIRLTVQPFQWRLRLSCVGFTCSLTRVHVFSVDTTLWIDTYACLYSDSVNFSCLWGPIKGAESRIVIDSSLQHK